MNFYQIERYLVKERLMRVVRDRTEPTGKRLEFWTRQAIQRAVEKIREIDGREVDDEMQRVAAAEEDCKDLSCGANSNQSAPASSNSPILILKANCS
jgi:hypothetical protein